MWIETLNIGKDVWKMISGILLSDRKKYSYEYDGGYLHVSQLYKRSSNWNTDYVKSSKTLFGSKFPKGESIIFYRDKQFHSPILENAPYAIDYMITFARGRQRIDAISFEIEELDEIYRKSINPIQISRFLDGTDFDGSLNIETKSFSATDSKDYYIKFRNKKFRAKIEITRIANFKNAVHLKTRVIFKIYGDFGNKYNLIFEMLSNVRNLFCFLSHRQNINIKEISIHKKLDSGKYLHIGIIDFAGHNNSVLSYAKMDYDKKKSADFKSIKDAFGNIFQSIVDDGSILKFLPENHRDDKLIIPYNIVMTASVFEHEFERSTIKINHSSNKMNQKTLIKHYLNDLLADKDRLSINNDGVKEVKRLINLVNTDRLELRLSATFSEFSNILEPIGKNMCKRCGIVYDTRSISEAIAKLRNDIAHGSDGNTFMPSEHARCGLALMSRMVYIFRLKEAGVSDSNISQFISDLFG